MKTKQRRLEPLDAYDPYRPRVYGTASQIERRKRDREIIDMVMTNEAFSIEKEREIAARTRAIAEMDAAALEAEIKALEAERQRLLAR